MRYSDRAVFSFYDESLYDPEIGEHVYKELYSEIITCFVMDLGLEKSVKIFGDYQKGRKVVFIKNTYTKAFNRVFYRGMWYKVINDKQMNRVFYLEGDNSGDVNSLWNKKIKSKLRR